MTAPLPQSKGDGMQFASFEEVQLAYSLGKVATHAAIEVRLPQIASSRATPRSNPARSSRRPSAA